MTYFNTNNISSISKYFNQENGNIPKRRTGNEKQNKKIGTSPNFASNIRRI